MVGYKILSRSDSDSYLAKSSKFRSVMDFSSIFTYSSQPELFPVQEDSSARENSRSSDPNSMRKYTSLPQHDVESLNFGSAFDYKSIFSYSSGSLNVNDTPKPDGNDGSKNDDSAWASVNEVISNLVLMLSYVLVFFTLPISIWFCFKHLPQWERIVVYRIGKLHGVLGPGNIFIIPWLDDCTKLDLRTQLISHPTKQFLTKNHAIVEAGFSIYYRICDPVKYISNVRDPELQGFKKLSAAISLKKTERLNMRKDIQSTEKLAIEQQIQQELNVITSPWGVEISSVEIEGLRVIKAPTEPSNSFLSMMQQMGVNVSSDPSKTTIATPPSFENFACSNMNGLESNHALKLQSMINKSSESIENGTIICFMIGANQPLYADFSDGRGEVYENICPGEPTVTLSLSESLFDKLMEGASQSQFLQAYLGGQITIEGDIEVLRQLQKLLPNMQEM